MLILTLYDRKGIKLNFGDIVKVSDGKSFTFFSEVKYLEKDEVVAPFHTFSYHSFEKVDRVPKRAVSSLIETEYKIWYIPSDDSEKDLKAQDYEDYFKSWRDCDVLLQNRCFRIKLYNDQKTLF